MKRGRPTKYDPKYIDMVDKYLSNTGTQNMTLPMKEDFALYIGVNKTTLYEWAKKHKDFSNALNKIHIYQKKQLVNDGIYGGKEVNSTIVKLMLMNNHGMKERKDTTTKGKALPQPIYGGKSEV